MTRVIVAVRRYRTSAARWWKARTQIRHSTKLAPRGSFGTIKTPAAGAIAAAQSRHTLAPSRFAIFFHRILSSGGGALMSSHRA